MHLNQPKITIVVSIELSIKFYKGFTEKLSNRLSVFVKK